MSRRKRAFDNVFDIFVEEGRELSIRELKEQYPEEAAALRREFKGSFNKAYRKLRKVNRAKWAEVSDSIVHEEPLDIPEDLSPLDALRKAAEIDDED